MSFESLPVEILQAIFSLSFDIGTSFHHWMCDETTTVVRKGISDNAEDREARSQIERYKDLGRHQSVNRM